MESAGSLALLLASQRANVADASNKVAMVSISSRYARVLFLRALSRRPQWTLVPRARVAEATLQLAEYERIDFDAVFGPRQTRASCICIRKGLTRKACLAQVVEQHIRKHPASLLRGCVPETVVISTWDAFSGTGWLSKQFGVFDPSLALNECLSEAYAVLDDKTRWVLKPSIASKGAEVHVIRTASALKQAVSAWPDVREWVLQRYVPNLLLLDGGRKFHLRVFVVVVGALRVFLMREYIAFFAAGAFDEVDDGEWTHVTNAYHQRGHADFDEARSFRASTELPALACDALGLSLEQAEREFLHEDGRVLGGIARCLAEVFGAQRASPNVFQPAPQLFEHFGLDFLLDGRLQPWLLEFNSGPDLDQAGDRLQPLIETLVDGVVALGVDEADGAEGFHCVFDEDWTRTMTGKQRVFDSSEPVVNTL